MKSVCPRIGLLLAIAAGMCASRALAGIWVQPIIDPSPMIPKGHLQNGINGDASPRPDGKTPIMLAIEEHHDDVIDYLLAHGADLSIKDKAGEGVLAVAKRAGTPAEIAKLSKYLADHLNAADYYHGEVPMVAIVSGSSQTGTPDAGGSTPMSVIVTDVTGQPLADAPVRFVVENGHKNLLTNASSPDSPTLIRRTDDSGVTNANVHVPKMPGDQIKIDAEAGPPGSEAHVTFIVVAADDKNPADGPACFAPTDESAVLNTDGSIDVSWTNHTDDESSFKIWLRTPGAWKLTGTAVARASSVHIPAP